MGCDIHFHSEIKIKGIWHHHAERRLKRNYRVFAKLAGVRNDFGTVPISEPKGWPEDSTLMSNMDKDKYGSDGHSHSWLSAKEIQKFHEWLYRDAFIGAAADAGWAYEHENLPYFLGNHFDGFIKYPKDWPSEIEDVRYVFFFDN